MVVAVSHATAKRSRQSPVSFWSLNRRSHSGYAAVGGAAHSAAVVGRLTTDLGRVMALTLKHAAYDPEFLDRLVHWAELLRRLLASAGGLADLSAVINYILEVTELSAADVRDVLEPRVGTQASEAVMSTAEKLRAEGRAEGEARVLAKVLTLKFGPLTDAVTARVRSASAEELELWTERVLSAATLDDVLR